MTKPKAKIPKGVANHRMGTRANPPVIHSPPNTNADNAQDEQNAQLIPIDCDIMNPVVENPAINSDSRNASNSASNTNPSNVTHQQRTMYNDNEIERNFVAMRQSIEQTQQITQSIMTQFVSFQEQQNRRNQSVLETVNNLTSVIDNLRGRIPVSTARVPAHTETQNTQLFTSGHTAFNRMPRNAPPEPIPFFDFSQTVRHPPPAFPLTTTPMMQQTQGNASFSAIRNNFRAHHLKSSEIAVPKYKGAKDSKTPFDFLLELDRYQSILGYSDEEMLRSVPPMALKEDAYSWYRYEDPPFRSWEDLKDRLRLAFQPIGYQDDLRKELERRTQGPSEPLTSFIRVIIDYFERLGDPDISESMKVARILKNMHPEYRQALTGKTIKSLKDLKQAAYEAQEVIKSYRTYKPPPTVGSIEPSLAWKPFNSVTENSVPDSACVVFENNKNPPRLHFASIDPFTYHHAPKREVTFKTPSQILSPATNENTKGPATALVNRSSNFTPPLSSASPNFSTMRKRNISGGSDSGRVGLLKCFNCGSTEHFVRNCPNGINSNQGNARSPSPIRH